MSKVKRNKKEQNIYEKSVKPYYNSIDPDQCYIIYSQDRKLSSESQFSGLMPKQAKDGFGFNLLCDDLSKSVKEAEAYRFQENIVTPFPKVLKDLKSYDIETNTLNLFVLHKISPKIGFGISTYSALKKGRVIAEYVGERKPLGTYIPDDSYVVINDDGTKIDGKYFGNVARFFHHCPTEHNNKQVMTENIAAIPWKISDTLTKVFFIVTRDIKEFEPICWNYGPKYQFDHDIELLDAETYLPLDELKHEL